MISADRDAMRELLELAACLLYTSAVPGGFFFVERRGKRTVFPVPVR